MSTATTKTAKNNGQSDRAIKHDVIAWTVKTAVDAFMNCLPRPLQASST